MKHYCTKLFIRAMVLLKAIQTGHPTWEVLETLQAYGCRVYRTDLNGDVEIRVS